MRSTHPIGRWPRLGFVARVAVAVALSAALATPWAEARTQAKSRPATRPRVWDAQRVLSSTAREALESQLATAEARAGVPFFVLVTDRLHGEPVAELAARIYAEHQLGADPARNVVLLVLAVESGAAAVETGKGNAGIVPELDARRILKELTANLSPHHPERALARAVPELAAAARATAARRRPLPRPPEDPEPPASDAAPTESDPQADAAAGDSPAAAGVRESIDAGEAGPDADAGAPGGTPGREKAEPAAGARRSRVPLAAAIGVLVLVGLGLRRRRQLTGTRPDRARDSDDKKGRRPF